MPATSRVLLISNRPDLSEPNGQVDAYRELAEQGHIGHVRVVSWDDGRAPQDGWNYEGVVEALGQGPYDVVVLWSPMRWPILGSGSNASAT